MNSPRSRPHAYLSWLTCIILCFIEHFNQPSEFYDLPNGSVTFFTITSPQQACLSISNFHRHFPDRALSMTLRSFSARSHHLFKDVNRLPSHQKSFLAPSAMKIGISLGVFPIYLKAGLYTIFKTLQSKIAKYYGRKRKSCDTEPTTRRDETSKIMKRTKNSI